MQPDDLATARARVRQLLEFLKAFNEQRNPVIRRIEDYRQVAPRFWSTLPVASLYMDLAPLEDPQNGANVAANDPANGDEDDFVLRVTRPDLSAAPPPPPEVAPWVLDGWQDPGHDVRLARTRYTPERGDFAADEREAALLQRWQDARDVWAARNRDAYAAAEVFDWVWDVHQVLEREGERFELVLGDGHLVWDAGGTPIDHPLILQRLQIEFDARLPRFTIRETTAQVEFADPILRVAGVDGQVIARFRDEERLREVHPLGAGLTDDFLQELVTTLHPNGRVRDERPATTHEPQVYRDPVIYLRLRSLGFASMIALALEDVESRTDFSEALLSLVGIYPDPGSAEPVGSLDPFDPANADIYLTKEANEEQLEIARRLERYGAVVVQGPPGTGKTHTIANLIGHLLAEGRSVLVTSETTKALRVLREKVVEPLQPLCVSVLEGDAASNAQLAESALAIGTRLSEKTADQYLREAARKDEERRSLLGRIESARARLIKVVEAEYTDVVVPGATLRPIDAARRLADGAGRDDWIPGEVTPGVTCPLTDADIRELYRLNATLPDDDLQTIDRGLPDPAAFPHPEEFREQVARLRAGADAAAYRPGLWRTADVCTKDALAEFIAEGRACLEPLAALTDWELEVLTAATRGPAETRPWELLADSLEHAFAAARDERLARAEFNLEFTGPAGDPAALAHTLQEMEAHTRAGGGFGRMSLFAHGDRKAVLANARVLGKPPLSAEDFKALSTVPAAAIAWHEARQRWSAIMAQFSVEPPGTSTHADEAVCAAAAAAIRHAIGPLAARLLALRDLAASLGLELSAALGAALPATSADGWRALASALPELERVIAAEAARLAESAAASRDAALLALLSRFDGYADSASTVGALSAVLRAADPDAYSIAYARLVALYDKRDRVARRNGLLHSLEAHAPRWALDIRVRKPPHDATEPPGDPAAAWLWKQLAQALDERAEARAEPLIREIEGLKQQLRDVSSEVIDGLAWGKQAERTMPEALAALKAYVQTVRRIGRGTGKRAPSLRADARQYMSAARDAVPVWIAPLTRVAEAFDPRRAHFDVVIIDEASQLDPLGLLAWYLGKQIIVVGDDQQVTPSAVGQGVAGIQALINTFLDGIPHKGLYDGQTSVYHHAQRVFRGPVSLVEHFRCVPDIITFSNSLSYNWAIKPLRDASTAGVFPAVVFERLADAARVGDVNEVEAVQVASLVCAAIEQPEYAGLTFGVIALLRDRQAPRIEQILRSALSLDEIQRRRLVCGAAPHFQGDERDVIFLSLVEGRPVSPPHNRLGDPGDQFKKRYNVAASRARDQLWVVHSMAHEVDLQPDDLRRRLLEFAADPAGLRATRQQAHAKAQSEFEKAVIDRLLAARYHVEPQYSAGAYFIDIVVGTGAARLAVECDGDRYHNIPEKIREDLDRQALLERIGWRFHRIRGSAFYRNPDLAMRDLFEALGRAGVDPDGTDAAAPTSEAATEVLERVRRRAAEIREEWRSRGIVPPTPPPPHAAAGAPPPPPSPSAPPPPSDPDGTGSPSPGPDHDEAPSGTRRPEDAPPVAGSTGLASASPNGRLPFAPYEIANLRAFLPGTPSLGDDAARTIEPMILEVARVEGPLHFETLIERLRMRYGMARARQSTRTHLVRILGAMASRGVISVLRRDAGEDLFVALPGTPAHPRGPGIMGIRRALHVAPEELAAGLRALFVAERGGYRDDLIRKAAREFGWTRTGDDVYAVLDAALDSLLRSGEVRERYGRLELSGSAAMGLDSASTSPANR